MSVGASDELEGRHSWNATALEAARAIESTLREYSPSEVKDFARVMARAILRVSEAVDIEDRDGFEYALDRIDRALSDRWL